MKLIVTGGAGFIGSCFVRLVLGEGLAEAVTNLDKLTYAGNLENLEPVAGHPGYQFEHADICDEARMLEVFERERPDAVVHFAAESHVDRAIHSPAAAVRTNVGGTFSLLEAARRTGVRRFVHVSTSEVYGTCRSDQEKMNEDHPLEPCSPYASAKAGADRLIYSYWKTHDLPAVIVRPFNNYGPRQHLEKCIPRFVTSALMDEPLTVHGTGFSSRDWMYVDDTCEAIDALVHAPANDVVGQTFNLGTEVSTDVLAIAHMVLEKTGKSQDLVAWVGDRPGQVDKHRSDSQKIGRVLGWTPDTDLSAGLDATIEWYTNNESFWRPQLWMRKIKISTAKGREWH